MDDDIFDEEASEMEVISQEWNQVCQSRLKNGYVEGATIGQQETIQNGFNSGFKQGLISCFLLSKMKGILTGLMAYQASYEGHPISDDIILDTHGILETISTLETDCVAEDFLSMSLTGVVTANTKKDPTSSADALEMDIDINRSTTSCNNCTCNNKSDNEQANENQQDTYTDIKATEFLLPNLEDTTLEDAKRILLNCPQITEVVKRCKAVLKRLKWTDVMIDQLI